MKLLIIEEDSYDVLKKCYLCNINKAMKYMSQKRNIHRLTLLLCLHLFILTSAFAIPNSLVREKKLSKIEAREVGEKIKSEWVSQTKIRLSSAYRNHIIKDDSREMPLWWAVYGEKPIDGYSLYISLHGGGGTTREVNNQQWENQKRLYRPKNSVYVAPRAPWNLWNMWCKEGIDALYEQLIQMGVAYEGVNPDKVYVMGYSAGGDGVWRLGPRMADTWAAASMMAGHPGDVSLVNLRNTPFMIWCGENDAAYDRNRLNAERGVQMDSLQRQDIGGYIHETHIVKGKGHWMDRVDTVAVSWMAQYRRNPYPKHIVWQQEEVLKPYFYWLGVSQNEMKRGKTVRAAVQGNKIILDRCDYSSLTIYLNDELVNLNRPVEVICQGKRLFKRRVPRTESMMRQTLTERNDWGYMFPAMIKVIIK